MSFQRRVLLPPRRENRDNSQSQVPSLLGRSDVKVSGSPVAPLRTCIRPWAKLTGALPRHAHRPPGDPAAPAWGPGSSARAPASPPRPAPSPEAPPGGAHRRRPIYRVVLAGGCSKTHSFDWVGAGLGQTQAWYPCRAAVRPNACCLSLGRIWRVESTAAR